MLTTILMSQAWLHSMNILIWHPPKRQKILTSIRSFENYSSIDPLQTNKQCRIIQSPATLIDQKLETQNVYFRIILRVTWTEYFTNWPTLLKPTRKVDLGGIRTRIFGSPDRCSTNSAIESTRNSMLVLSNLSGREIVATILRSISVRMYSVSTLFQNHPHAG